MEKELAPHGINVTFDDVRLIIGILYCVGTVEISPPRIESLLLMAQVLGIPSLIRFLRRIKESLITEDQNRTSLSPVKKALVYVQLPPTSIKNVETRSLTFEQHSTSLFQTRRVLPEPPNLVEDRDIPSRSGSRATLASLSSFPFNPMSSPAHENSPNNPPILDSLDPSFLNQLNNLQANQIDDLENALLPHLHNEETSSTTLQFKKTTTVTTVEDSFNSTVDEAGLNQEPLLPLLPPEGASDAPTAEELPKSCSTPIRRYEILSDICVKNFCIFLDF